MVIVLSQENIKTFLKVSILPSKPSLLFVHHTHLNILSQVAVPLRFEKQNVKNSVLLEPLRDVQVNIRLILFKVFCEAFKSQTDKKQSVDHKIGKN